MASSAIPACRLQQRVSPVPSTGALLRQRVTDPGFASTLQPLQRAELDLLATAPQDFVSCIARRAQNKA